MKNKAIHILLILLFVCGLSVTAYPFVSNRINELTNESHINEYNSEVSFMSEKEKSDILSKAKAYNEILGKEYYLDNGEVSKEYETLSESYDDILNLDNSLIGYIEISKIGVKLPIYHETKPNALTMGAIHTKRSSFPIGGKGTHSVISAHSAYPSQKFFDNIDELEKGDEFQIKILDETLRYKVVEINIVKPTDSSKLKIDTDRDLVTLCTCYPYSVNTHRLLVTGERAKKTLKSKSAITKEKTHDPLPGIAAAAVFGIVMLIVWRKKCGKEN